MHCKMHASSTALTGIAITMADVREVVHHKIKGRTRFYKHVDVEPVEDGKVRVCVC